MIHSTLLSVNPIDGARTFMHTDDVTGMLHFETAADIQAVLEYNLLERNETEAHTGWGDGRRIARIPMFILSMLKREHKDPADHPVAFARWLDDHPKFKVRNGTMRGLLKDG